MFDSVDTLSRSLTLEASQTASRVAVFSQLKKWRLVITSETPATAKLDISQANTQRTITLDIPPFQSAVEYTGYGNCVVSVENLSDSQSSLIQVSFEEPIEHHPYSVDSGSLLINDAQKVAVPPLNGYRPSFTNYASINTNGDIRVYLEDLNGNQVFYYVNILSQEPNEYLLRDIPVPAHCKLLVTNASSGTQANVSVVWSKK